MNIKFTKSVTASSAGKVTSVNSGNIELCSMGSNRGEGDQVIPIKLGNAVVAPLVTVKSATTRNKRGTTSALIKVAMPYTAFAVKKSYVTGELGSQVIKTTLVQDPSRTGGEISLHIVAALPSAMTTDLNRTDDGTGEAKLMREAAFQQLNALASLLSQLSGPHLMPGNPVMSRLTGPDDMTYTADPASTAYKAVVLSTNLAEGADVESLDSNGQTFLDTHIMGTDGTDYGAGLNASHVAAPVLLHNALGRIVRGQPALACDDIAPEMQVSGK